MADEIVFYSSPMSRGRIVHWMLEEVGVPYRFEVVNLESGDHKKPSFLAVNPMGKVPAIAHRGVVVTECAAICAYLADAFPGAKLAPADRQSFTRYLLSVALLWSRLRRGRRDRQDDVTASTQSTRRTGLRQL